MPKPRQDRPHPRHIHLGTDLAIAGTRLIELAGQITGMALYGDGHPIDELIGRHILEEAEKVADELEAALFAYAHPSKASA